MLKLLFILIILTCLSVINGIDKSIDPYIFVQSAKDEPQELQFTMPEDIDINDPYYLINEANKMNLYIDNLMSQMNDYIKHFNITTGPESLQLKYYSSQLLLLQTQYQLLNVRYDLANDKLTNLTDEMDIIKSKILCYSNSNCHPVPVTTTIAPPPTYSCNKTSDHRIIDSANQTGKFQFLSWYDFGNNCNLTIKSKYTTGLMYNLTITDFKSYKNGKLIIKFPGSDDVYTITNQTMNINNIRSRMIEIFPSGDLTFTLAYVSIDVCQNYNCGNGRCLPTEETNEPECVCDSCYSLDDNGICTISKDPCEGQNPCNYYNQNGICIKNPDCSYYCKCPGSPPNCTTNQYCLDDTGCNSKKKSFLQNIVSYLPFIN